jgi:hypothetical protein
VFGNGISAMIRSYILNSLTIIIANDIINNGLSPADEAIIDSILAAP